MEAWQSASLAAQQHSEASWKHLTCCDSEAFIQMSTSSAALHQIRELRCDFLFNRAAWGLPVHQVEGKGKQGHVLKEMKRIDREEDMLCVLSCSV